MANDWLLGIDTGGTYTDGVLLDYASRSVVKTAKTPTTHHDLRIGILTVLEELIPQGRPESIRLVAISTTLATNAIAEGKGRPVALLLLGYDPELIRRFQFADHFATARFHYLDGGHDLYGRAQAPLAEADLMAGVEDLSPEVDAFAVSGYFSPFNPAHELRAFELIKEAVDRPVVLGHQLSSRLNSIQRATTATLNASLLAILDEFIKSIQSSMKQRGLEAPLMVVRGDGALMGDAVAVDKPVETVHSGPAASAIGGQFLAGIGDAVVIDVGGTTTDIALIKEGGVQISEEGTTVGDFSTAVRAAEIRSIGLGGDSQIQFNVEDHLVIGPARVQPLARLASDHPRAAEEIERLRTPEPDRLEYWFLLREPNRALENVHARRVLDLLAEGPRSLPEILDRLELIHPLQFQSKQLLRSGLVGRAGLTPTDLFHFTGEFAPWDRKAASKAAWAMARSQGLTPEALAQEVHEAMAERVVAEVISFISGCRLDQSPQGVRRDDLGVWLFRESIAPEDHFLASRIQLKVPLIGIGAPARLVLPRVAELLEAELIIPPHHEVANAVGAVAGSVAASQEAWIYPQMRGRHVGGYYVQAGAGRKRFATLEQARVFAAEQCRQAAEAQAARSGVEQPQIDMRWIEEGAESYRLRVQASGASALG
ncbi:MAG: hydantoinase/oxoprolinase N-terminal domain-containing protein [Anaerolineales bacterium]